MGSNRAHDLIDLRIIVSESEINYQKTKETCTRLFSYREQQEWPPVVIKGENWDEFYVDQIEGLPVKKNIDEAIAWTNLLITKIDSSD